MKCVQLYQACKRMLCGLDCSVKGVYAWQSFPENNFADFLDEVQVNIIQISSSRWSRFVTPASAALHVNLKFACKKWTKNLISYTRRGKLYSIPQPNNLVITLENPK